VGDLNGLKLINDAFGHEEGDKLLIEVANMLKMCCRSDDITARIGGDEFCILLPQTDSQKAQSIVERIKKTSEEYMNSTRRETYHASIALGYATKQKIEEPIDKVFRIAEEYMYRRKLLEYKSIHSSIISSIKTTMFEKSYETEAHAERLAELSKKLGEAIGLDDKEITELELLSTLHDIGKISIDDSILSKSGKLTEKEWFEIKKHPEVGYRITQASPELKNISEYILSHHERWDGNGYPQGLSGDNIPLLSRILAVVDSYDAMTQDRVYRKAMTKKDAIEEIRKNAGTQFDPEIAVIFIEKVLKST
jgi:diguanylate cyclase (GGDEF)-like protein